VIGEHQGVRGEYLQQPSSPISNTHGLPDPLAAYLW
jgi:hypothetical protein